MADPLYSVQCDPLTGQCFYLDGSTGQYLTDENGAPVTFTDPSMRTTTAQQAQGTAAPSATPVSQDPYTDYEIQRAIGVNTVQPSTPYPTVLPTDATATPTFEGTDYTSYGASGRSRSSSGYTPASYDDPTVPRYGNTAVHPFFGGDPLTPGGAFAQQDDGYDNRQQVSVPGGATAGPFAVRAAYPPDSGRTGNYGSPGGSSHGGGGGGGGSSLYWAMRNKLTGSGSHDSYEPERYRPYRGPDDPRTARRVEKLQLREQGKASTYGQPTQMMPGINLESPVANYLQGLPMTDLTLIAGAGTKNWAGGIDPTGDIYESYYKKLNKRLKKGKPGIDFLPYYRKQLRKDKSTEQFNALLKDTYGNLVNGQRWDTDALMQNLTNPKKGTFLHQQQKKTPFSQSAEQFLQSYGAILGTGGYSENQINALASIAQDAVTRYGQAYGQRNPRRAPSLNQYVGSALQPYMQRTGGTF